MLLLQLTKRIQNLKNPIIWSLYNEYLAHYLGCSHCIHIMSYILRKKPGLKDEFDRQIRKYTYHYEECSKSFTRAKLYISPEIKYDWGKIHDRIPVPGA